MPIDYFDPANRSETAANCFGLCDDMQPALTQAYIDIDNKDKWIAIVKNFQNKTIFFHPIDNCVIIWKAENKMDKRCDGILTHDNCLIFVELKNRAGGQWLKDGREQLTATIKRFKQEFNINQFDKVEAYVCNSLRPEYHAGQMSNIQMFKDDTGLILKAQRNIDI